VTWIKKRKKHLLHLWFIATLHEKTSQSDTTLPGIQDHTVLPVTWHRKTRPALVTHRRTRPQMITHPCTNRVRRGATIRCSRPTR